MLVGKRKGFDYFWWAVHNVVAHPLSFILHALGDSCHLLAMGYNILGDVLQKGGEIVHDETVPVHNTEQEG